jgi:hypothetical protein
MHQETPGERMANANEFRRRLMALGEITASKVIFAVRERRGQHIASLAAIAAPSHHPRVAERDNAEGAAGGDPFKRLQITVPSAGMTS